MLGEEFSEQIAGNPSFHSRCLRLEAAVGELNPPDVHQSEESLASDLTPGARHHEEESDFSNTTTTLRSRD